jgi:hypothetical protein
LCEWPNQQPKSVIDGWRLGPPLQAWAFAPKSTHSARRLAAKSASSPEGQSTNSEHRLSCRFK